MEALSKPSSEIAEVMDLGYDALKELQREFSAEVEALSDDDEIDNAATESKSAKAVASQKKPAKKPKVPVASPGGEAKLNDGGVKSVPTPEAMDALDKVAVDFGKISTTYEEDKGDNDEEGEDKADTTGLTTVTEKAHPTEAFVVAVDRCAKLAVRMAPKSTAEALSRTVATTMKRTDVAEGYEAPVIEMACSTAVARELKSLAEKQ